MYKLKFILITFLLSGMLFIGDYLIKYAVKSSNTILWLLFAAFMWTASIPGWYYLMSYERLSIVGALFSVMSLIMVPLIGIFCFNETFTIKEWTGVGFAIISVFLLTNKL